jgi:hypothetical protein
VHAAAEASNKTWDDWHRRMGHLAKSGLEKLARGDLVEGFIIDESSPPFSQCEACVKAKMTTKPYPQEAKDRREDPGELTHSDIWGPARVESLKKSKYAILFSDDATRHCRPEFLKSRDQAFEKIKEYIAWVERQFGYTPKVLRVDNAKELTSGVVKAWLKSRGITLQNTIRALIERSSREI